MDTPPPPNPTLFRRILAKNFIALKELPLTVGLTTFNLFGMGVTFTGVDGRILPRRARVLLYFGVLLLVVACMLFQSNEREVLTDQAGGIQVLANSLFALSALGLGIPYLIWLA